MNKDDIVRIIIATLLAVGGGSYATHSHDVIEQERQVDNNTMSCSEVIQLVIDNKGDNE